VGKVEKPGTGVVYEMDLKKDKEGVEVQFSPNGDVLKKVPWKEEKD
jgi:antitoxin component YwqK of YwqJK toxin-antitoxin module